MNDLFKYSVEELSAKEIQQINGGEYDVLNWLVDNVSFGVGYAGEKLKQGLNSFMKHAPNGSITYIN
jgi:hypothetical protein